VSRGVDLKTRVLFSFSEEKGSSLEGEAAVLYRKAAEMFQTKRQLGCLKHWLLELVYKEARRELGLTVEPEVAASMQEAVKKAVETEVSQPKPEAATVSQLEADAESQAVKSHPVKQQSEAKGFEKGGEISINPISDSFGEDALTMEGDSDYDDMADFLPLTLSGEKRDEQQMGSTPKGKPMPKGISSLVHSN